MCNAVHISKSLFFQASQSQPKSRTGTRSEKVAMSARAHPAFCQLARWKISDKAGGYGLHGSSMCQKCA